MTGRLRDNDWHVAYGPGDDALRTFYIPALQRSARYDRSAGFFSSSALAVAAAGVAHLVASGGRMRLLVGADLDRADVEAIRRGHDLISRVENRLLRRIDDPLDELGRDRRAVLAWMVAEGTLQIRVVLRKGPDGVPLSADESIDYYHPKTGIFTDFSGDRLAFSGSVNESETAWLHNYELFQVFRSWDATAAHLAYTAKRFDDLWEDREEGWIALGVPEAVRERLIRYRPASPPIRDPFEEQISVEPAPPVDATRFASLLAEFIRDAAKLPNGERVGAATSAVVPWPHQDRVADAVIRRYPERFLIADEVGLGKTIEAGLALRQLTLAGAVDRALLLTPASVVRQWQEELYEKFALNVPRFDGETFWDVFGEERPSPTANPFDSHRVAIASSQLMKRRDRQHQLLGSRPFDLVIVDEAHHARRKDILQPVYRPNRLLELLHQLKGRTQGLLLLTATPMQVHPIELWDLLRLIGLGGRWGSNPSIFLRYFDELRREPDDVDWDFILRMLHDELEITGGWDPSVEEAIKVRLGPVDWLRLQHAIDSPRPGEAMRKVSTEVRTTAVELARQHTPLRRLVFRNTRSLLRRYREKGILKENVATRDVKPRWIALRSEDEQLLYDRLDDYISNFYSRYERERVGLGFVMTVYRRRLTSSFFAVRRSLERRLAYLRGELAGGLEAAMTAEDLEQEDLDLDVTEELDAAQRRLFADEIVYVEDFITDLKRLGTDSKLVQLHDELRTVLRARETAVIYTQYTDTLDYLRDELRAIYGSKVACYSGRGGEVWRNGAWMLTTKEEIKTAFRGGEEVKILLCTEAASEGLNLQTCGVLINYDMPWNPMRVEQRIGRIDRIGQRYSEVWIRNYFYEGTVEAVVYDRLSDRIGWFEHVVGELQPILSQIGRSIQELALAPHTERANRLEREIARLRHDIEERRFATLDLDAYLDESLSAAPAAPVVLSDLEALLTTHRTIGPCFSRHPDVPRVYQLRWQGTTYEVTFDRATFDDHPYSIRFLTLGDELFDSLLGSVEPPEIGGLEGVARAEQGWELPLAAYYAPVDGEALRLTDLGDLKHRLSDSQLGWSETGLESVRAHGALLAKESLERLRYASELLERGERLAIEERARQILVEAATAELVLSQQTELFGDQPPPWQFSEDAVRGLIRHKYPFAPLLTLVDVTGIAPSQTDLFYLKIQGESAAQLRSRFAELTQRAKTVLRELSAAAPSYRLPDATLDVAILRPGIRRPN